MKRKILITKTDYDKLIETILQSRSLGAANGSLDKIGEELKKATLVQPEKVPADVVTMNSTVEVVDKATLKKMTLQLVYPADADIRKKRISVFAPVGTALIGYREGDEIEWEVPGGRKTFRIQKVLHQPEAAGDFSG